MVSESEKSFALFAISSMTINALPAEILSEIFIHCLPEDPLSIPQPNVLIAPLSLCRVCSSWRTLATHTPQLWQIVGVNLQYAWTQLYGSGFPRKRLDVLEAWNQRMGVLRPSIALGRQHHRVVYNKEEDVVSDHDFFKSRVLRNVRALDLNGFPESDLKILSEVVDSFPHLTHLVLREPGGREHNLKKLRFPSTPNLTHLYFDCYFENWPMRPVIRSMFTWAKLTHLCANLEMDPSEWRTMLFSCHSLTHALVQVRFITPIAPIAANASSSNPSGHAIDSIKPIHPSLRVLVIHATLTDLDIIFQKTNFDHLEQLRLCMGGRSLLKLDSLHRMLSFTPRLKELHLRGCSSNGVDAFLDYTADVTLNTYVPELQVLVADAAVFTTLPTVPDDLYKVLNSAWLTRGWEPLHHAPGQKRVLEIMLNLGRYISQDLAALMRKRIVHEPHPVFDVRMRAEGEGVDFTTHTRWRQLLTGDLEGDWKKLMGFSTV